MNDFIPGFNVAQSVLTGQQMADQQRTRAREREIESLQQSISETKGFNLAESEELARLAGLNPALAAQTISAFSSLDESRQKDYFESARKGLNLLNAGETEKLMTLVKDRHEKIKRLGGDTTDTDLIGGLVMQGRVDEARGLLSEAVNAGIASGFLPQTSEQRKPEIGRYKSQVVGNTLVITDSATGEVVQEITKGTSEKEKLELKKLEAQVNKAETEAELKARTAQTEDDKKQASLDMATQAADLAEKILYNPALSNITGTFDAMTPVVRPESQDVLNDAKRLESLLTVDNLKLMSGVLTDKDISFLTRVGSGLNITDTGIKGSEKAVKARLNEIVAKLRGAAPKKNTVGRFTIEVE